ncbi:hypothetical protein PF011_g24559 [Phytophthora fragariae]|uniref:Uncharacterized protein n=1 Tax=Phytophthora fragariae TaxID=53985 RepID=A0A6A3I1G8_9STRA|nr:hypothetical protein PF011_g24559 [Phytophthora fragariae]
MAISTVYVLLKPGSLDTDGYAYGKICSAAQRGKYDVERFSSGRWAESREFSSHLSAAQVDPRRVSEDEALSGIGTYVGSALCIARVPRGRPKVWDYGMVVGYSWKEDEKSGILQVTFEDKTCEIPYGREELQDLAIETYALRPCIMRSVADVMPTEMRSIHNMVHDHFNGIGQSARRNSTIILRKLKMNQVDEAQLVPVFNIENTRVEYLPIEHILNFVSYFQGKRRAPQGASVPTALFTEPVGPPTAESTPLQSGSNDTAILQQLYDSDDDLVPIDSTQEEAQAPRTKRDRDVTQEAPADRGQGRLIALRRRLDDDPEMVRDIDQLIALRQADLGKGSSSSLVATAGSDTKLQFKPSRQQAVTHGALVNGKYSSLDAQLFAETMQSQSKEFDFLPHPGVARGFYGWDFGYRGLSSMHFSPIDLEEERQLSEKFDMTDFSMKNKLPRPPRAEDLADVVSALEVLSLLVVEMYNSLASELVNAARRFLLLLRKTKSMRGPEAVPELVAWIDECFERFRSCLAREDIEGASQVKNYFQFGHESYARVVQRVTSLKWMPH